MATPSPALRLSLTSLRTTLRRSMQQPPPPTQRHFTTTPLRPVFSSSSTTQKRTARSRSMHTTPPTERRKQPLAHNREEVPEQAPPTDFGQLDMLASAPVPTTSVDVCHEDGFSLNSGVHIRGGDGALLVGGEAFVWRPWEGATIRQQQQDGGGDSEKKKGKNLKKKGKGLLVNEKGQWEVGEEGFAVLGLVWPRPDLLILGLGPEIRPLSPATRQAITNLGMRVEILDTRNAASQYNMLATERGMGDVAAALLPIGWKDGAE